MTEPTAPDHPRPRPRPHAAPEPGAAPTGPPTPAAPSVPTPATPTAPTSAPSDPEAIVTPAAAPSTTSSEPTEDTSPVSLDKAATAQPVEATADEEFAVPNEDAVSETTAAPAVRAEIGPVTRPKAAPRPPGPRSPWWQAAVLVVVVAALTAATVWFLVMSPKDSSTKARDEAVAAAKTYTAFVMTYNYKTLDDDKSRAMAHLTGGFKADYGKSMDEVVKPQAPAQKAIVEGTVNSAGLESVSSNGKQVTCLIIGAQKVSNISLTEPRTDPVRLRVTLDRVGKQWMISNLVAL